MGVKYSDPQLAPRFFVKIDEFYDFDRYRAQSRWTFFDNRSDLWSKLPFKMLVTIRRMLANIANTRKKSFMGVKYSDPQLAPRFYVKINEFYDFDRYRAQSLWTFFDNRSDLWGKLPFKMLVSIRRMLANLANTRKK